MIVLRLQDWDRYAELGELRLAFDFLEHHRTASDLADGRHEIDEDRAYAIMITHTPKPASECRFETHQRYADIVYLVEGTEMIGYDPAEMLAPAGSYDQGRDLAFYKTPEFYTPVLLRAGMVAVFYPEDGHMPGVIYEHAESVRKIVVKTRVMPLGLPKQP
jgi:biofilm protein TabA